MYYGIRLNDTNLRSLSLSYNNNNSGSSTTKSELYVNEYKDVIVAGNGGVKGTLLDVGVATGAVLSKLLNSNGPVGSRVLP